MTRVATLVLGVVLLGVNAAHAAPVLWTLSGITFDDGAVATGSFIFDADTLVYSDIDITTTDGPVLSGASYVHEHTTFPTSPLRLIVADALPLDIGVHAMNLSFSAALTNAGGTVALGPFAKGIEGLCTSAFCGGVDPSRDIVAGEIHGTAVPEPATMVLLGAGLYAFRRRRLALSRRE
jgi:hypothetical protein